MRKTCAPLLGASARALPDDRARVAYAICAAVATAEDAATWFHRNPEAINFSDKVTRQRTRAKLEQVLATIAATRAVLERVDAVQPLFVIEPGNWHIDFDGDGRVSLAEQHFFWVPRREAQLHPLEPATTGEQLRRDYLSPVIHVDQADVYWAVAYCHFGEAALNLVLAYDFDRGGAGDLLLADPERIRSTAYKRLTEGVRYSMKLRTALLRETDDDREWIANPRQRNTSFPLVMDAQTFDTWGNFLTEMQRLLQGKALLGGSVETRGLWGMSNMTWNLCKDGEGLNLRDLFANPLKHPLDTNELSRRCVKPTVSIPMSGLADIASSSIARNVGKTPQVIPGEWMLLRYLYWVN